jgi:hypothetical protein
VSRRIGGLLYPILFAAALVLGVASRGAGQYRGSGLAVLTAFVAIVVAIALAVVFLITRLIERSDRAAPLAAALTMLGVAWVFFYVPAQRAAQAITWRGSRDIVLMPLGVLATLAVLSWLFRQSRERLVAVNSFMTRFGVLLVAIVALQLARAPGTPATVRGSVLVQQLSRPLRVSTTPAVQRNSPKRDIYLIVLDEHPNARVSRENLHFDNSAFDDSLRARGFVIPRDVRSNYAQTILSVPSILNAAHVTQLAKDAGPKNTSYALPRYLVENNRVARFLKEQGYKYVLFPSQWWTPTRHSPMADVEFNARPAFNFANEARRTELRIAVLNSTLLKYLPQDGLDTLFDFRSMRGISEMPADSAPTFVFAHFLLPHIPYYLDASCRAVERPILPSMEDTTRVQRDAFIAQMQCVDRTVLEVVTKLVRDSRPEPIILVVGDHGSRLGNPRFTEQPDKLTAHFLQERFGALGAFYLPAGGDSALAGSVTLVNVMGHVLRYYFNVDLPPSSDEMYVSGYLPYDYRQVDSMGYVKTSVARSDSAPSIKGQ